MYEFADVEKLLTCMFHDAYDMDDEFDPDPDMPRASADLSKTGSWLAKKVDIERAWRFSFLGHLEREAAILRFSNGLERDEIARALELTSGDVQILLDSAVLALHREINTGSRRKALRQAS